MVQMLLGASMSVPSFRVPVRCSLAWFGPPRSTNINTLVLLAHIKRRMGVDLTKVESVIVILSGMIGLSIPLIKTYKRINNKFTQILEHINEIADLKKSLGTIFQMIEKIKGQVEMNGGGSMHDVLNRVEVQGIIHSQIIRYMMSSSDVGSCIFDIDGNITDIDRGACKILGWSESELLGRSWLSRVVNRDRAKTYSEWASSIDQRRDFDQTMGVKKSDDTIVRIRLRAYPLTDTRKSKSNLGSFGIITVEYEENSE